jgi:PAS domain-containing protein
VLIAPHPWTVRLGLAIFFAILAGIAFGRLIFRVGNQRRSSTERAGTSEQHLPDETDAVSASALLEATMKNMREGMLVVDEALRVVASNRTAREIFSQSRDAGGRSSNLRPARSPAAPERRHQYARGGRRLLRHYAP